MRCGVCIAVVPVGVVVGVPWESGPAAASAAASAASVRLAARAARRGRAVALVDHQVDRHLAFQAADIAVAEVIAEFVNLEKNKQEKEVSGIPSL